MSMLFRRHLLALFTILALGSGLASRAKGQSVSIDTPQDNSNVSAGLFAVAGYYHTNSGDNIYVTMTEVNEAGVPVGTPVSSANPTITTAPTMTRWDCQLTCPTLPAGSTKSYQIKAVIRSGTTVVPNQGATITVNQVVSGGP